MASNTTDWVRTYTRVKSSNACPICSHTDWCAFGHAVNTKNGEVDDGWVKCMRKGFGDAPDSAGWTCDPNIKGSSGGSKWLPPGHQISAPVSEEERQKLLSQAQARAKKRDADAAAKRKMKRRRLGMMWGQAESHTYIDPDRAAKIPNSQGLVPACELTPLGLMALEWFRGRGIDLFDVGLPRAIRMHPAADDTYNKERQEWNTALAMVAKVTGVHPESPKPELHALHCTYLEQSQEGVVKRSTGDDRHAHGPIDNGVIRLAGFYGEGVLLIGEGIETTLAAWLAAYRCGRTWAAWSTINAVCMRGMQLPTALFGEPYEEGKPAPSPELRGKLHTVLIAADLDLTRTGEAAAIETAQRIMKHHPWITAEVCLPHAIAFPDLVDRRGGVLVPKVGKSLDWNDVLSATDATKTYHGLLAPGQCVIDLAKNQLRKDQWLPSHAWGAVTVKHDTPVPQRRTKSASNDVELGEEDPRNPVPPAPPSPPKSLQETDEHDERPFLPASPLRRARQFLIETLSPPEEERADSGVYLRRSRGEWWEYTGKKWEIISSEHVFGRVAQWMSTKKIKNAAGETRSYIAKTEDVNEVLKMLLVDTAVESSEMPCWVRPSFDSEGKPLWSTALSAARHRAGLPTNKGIIAFENCLFKVDAWSNSQIDVMMHTPLWFSSNVLPYKLAIEDLQAAMNIDAAAGRVDAPGGTNDLLQSKCPNWLKFLEQVSDKDNEWCDGLQEAFGYTMTTDTSLQKMFVLVGQKRGGKGTTARVWQSVLGEKNFTTATIDTIWKENNNWSLVNKTAVFLNDVQVGSQTNVSAAKAALLQISGEDWFTLRTIYTNIHTEIKFSTKIIMTCNEIPKLMDNSTALSSRMIAFQFRTSFYGKEDFGLEPRLMSEVEGIALWGLLGLRRLKASMAKGKAMTIPQSSWDLLEEEARSQSPIYSFVEDNIIQDANAKTWCDDVYERYCAWSKDRGEEHQMAKPSLGKLLRPHLPAMGKTDQALRLHKDGSKKRERMYVGIKLVDVVEPATAAPGAPAWRDPSLLIAIDRPAAAGPHTEPGATSG